MTQDFSKVEQSIFDYISSSTTFDIRNISPKTLLFKEGIFDSMGFVLLIDYLEESYGITPADKDLIEENFESIEAITRYIVGQKEMHITQ
jgi:acyl carrier protein